MEDESEIIIIIGEDPARPGETPPALVVTFEGEMTVAGLQKAQNAIAKKLEELGA